MSFDVMSSEAKPSWALQPSEEKDIVAPREQTGGREWGKILAPLQVFISPLGSFVNPYFSDHTRFPICSCDSLACWH